MRKIDESTYDMLITKGKNVIRERLNSFDKWDHFLSAEIDLYSLTDRSDLQRKVTFLELKRLVIDQQIARYTGSQLIEIGQTGGTALNKDLRY